MFPPLIWLAFVILVVAIVVIGGLWAIRAGLWLQETSHGEEPDERDRDQRDRDRPRHHITTT